MSEQGRLVDVRRAPSPRYDYRPDDETPTLLVVHNISLSPDEFDGPWIDALSTGTINPQAHPFLVETAHLRVSTHCSIRRDGEIVQYVLFDKRAWYMGISQYQRRERCSDFFVGIELEGTDTLVYIDAQHQQPAAIMQVLIDYYPDITKNMTGHCDITSDWKTDPGLVFDWARFHVLVNKETA